MSASMCIRSDAGARFARSGIGADSICDSRGISGAPSSWGRGLDKVVRAFCAFQWRTNVSINRFALATARRRVMSRARVALGDDAGTEAVGIGSADAIDGADVTVAWVGISLSSGSWNRLMSESASSRSPGSSE